MRPTLAATYRANMVGSNAEAPRLFGGGASFGSYFGDSSVGQLGAVSEFSESFGAVKSFVSVVRLTTVPSKIVQLVIFAVAIVVAGISADWSCAGECFKYYLVNVPKHLMAGALKSHGEIDRALACFHCSPLRGVPGLPSSGYSTSQHITISCHGIAVKSNYRSRAIRDFWGRRYEGWSHMTIISVV